MNAYDGFRCSQVVLFVVVSCELCASRVASCDVVLLIIVYGGIVGVICVVCRELCVSSCVLCIVLLCVCDCIACCVS